LITVGRQEMCGREIGRQSVGYTEKSQCKADRQAAGIHCSKVVRQAGMQAGSWLACGREAEGKQAFRSTRSRKASMKQ
jgi:hypothetical protein